MKKLSSSFRPTFVTLALVLAGALAWAGCADDAARSPVGPDAEARGAAAAAAALAQELGPAIEAQGKHGPRLMAIEGVVGHGAGLDDDGEPAVIVYLAQSGVRGVPDRLDGVSVVPQVTGIFRPHADRTSRARPAPIGFSVGHPDITAGTIGARVTDGSGNVYILSNNHVLANSNEASEGDPSLQPGPHDGGDDPDDLLGTLADFQPIDFDGGDNVMDAAISAVDPDSVSGSTPSDEGYGAPGTTVTDATVDMPVQKYGRTTGHTHGTVEAVNVTVTVCYEGFAIFCTKSATFVDQVSITPGEFSDGGDSGSLIVTDDGNKDPVGLLFAGSSSRTIANPIGAVLERFGVDIDPTVPEATEADPVTDIAVTGVSAPSSAVQGDVVDVDVTVENVGDQDVTSDIDVSLTSDLDGAVASDQTISGGLAAGASTTLTYSWDTSGATIDDHTLTGSHDYADDDGTNDSNSTVVTVGSAVTDIAVTGVSAPSSAVQGDVVSVDVTVENVGDQDVTSDIDVSLTSDLDGAVASDQTISGGLAAGASTTLTYSWNTSGATSGDHTLTGSQDFADDDGTNDSNSTVVTVGSAVTDIAVTGVSAPSSVVEGDVVSVDVTVENVGNQDVTSDIDVSLTSDLDGAVASDQTISGGLAAGASTTLTYSWDTNGAMSGDHTLTGSHDYADDDPGNDSSSTVVTVEETSGSENVHVGDLDDAGSINNGRTWTAQVTITVHDGSHDPVADATVDGSWSDGATGDSSCTTAADGQCTVSLSGIRKRVGSVTFTVNGVTHGTLAYEGSSNHDADGDSDGTSITVTKP